MVSPYRRTHPDSNVVIAQQVVRRDGSGAPNVSLSTIFLQRVRNLALGGGGQNGSMAHRQLLHRAIS